MRLSREAIEEFKEVYSKETGEEISNEEAQELAEALLSLLRIVCRPLPKKEEKIPSDG